jgi:hypothetical protein
MCNQACHQQRVAFVDLFRQVCAVLQSDAWCALRMGAMQVPRRVGKPGH